MGVMIVYGGFVVVIIIYGGFVVVNRGVLRGIFW